MAVLGYGYSYGYGYGYGYGLWRQPVATATATATATAHGYGYNVDLLCIHANMKAKVESLCYDSCCVYGDGYMCVCVFVFYICRYVSRIKWFGLY